MKDPYQGNKNRGWKHVRSYCNHLEKRYSFSLGRNSREEEEWISREAFN